MDCNREDSIINNNYGVLRISIYEPCIQYTVYDLNVWFLHVCCITHSHDCNTLTCGGASDDGGVIMSIFRKKYCLLFTRFKRFLILFFILVTKPTQFMTFAFNFCVRMVQSDWL